MCCISICIEKQFTKSVSNVTAQLFYLQNGIPHLFYHLFKVYELNVDNFNVYGAICFIFTTLAFTAIDTFEINLISLEKIILFKNLHNYNLDSHSSKPVTDTFANSLNIA